MKRIKLIIVIIALSLTSARGQEVYKKANAFLATLSPELRAKTQFAITAPERFNWHFVPRERSGSTFRDFDPKQTLAAWEFLKASVSDQGYKKAVAIVALENVLMVIENQAPDNHYRDPLNYHFHIFGKPSKKGTWGWRFEGHHVSVSFMLHDGEIVSSTPSFFGTNPGIVMSGPDKDKEVLKQETDLGFALINMLDEKQLKKAVFAESAPPEIIGFNKRKAESLTPVGIPYGNLNAEQKAVLLQLLDVYVKNYELGFSNTLDKKIRKAGLDNLTFGWAGSLKAGTPNYYRIQGPMLLIEYDNTQNNANHVHTAVRDLTNDFAEDILKEHYQKEHP